jgi:hypothetical protein
MTRPIARHIVQGSSGQNIPTQAAPGQISTGKDCVFTSSVYLTAGRLERVAAELSERDWSLLGFVATSRLATSRQLIRRFWTNDPKANPARARAGARALKRLASWRVLDPLPGRAQGGVGGGSAPLVYSTGIGGVKLLARRGLHLRRLGTPGERYVNHTLACAEAVVDLYVAHDRGDLELIEVQQEPACHRTFLGAWGVRLSLKPDLFVRIGVGALEDRWFVEVDLATEHTGTLLAKTKRYIAHYHSGREQRDHGVYPRVIWAVPDSHRAGQIEQVLGRLPAESHQMFVVCLWNELVQRLAMEAHS